MASRQAGRQAEVRRQAYHVPQGKEKFNTKDDALE